MDKWGSTEIEELKRVYVNSNIPSDTLIKNKDHLVEFTQDLNNALGTTSSFTEEEVAGQLLKLRKSGKLPRLR